jgi:hypothetical protein
MFRAVLNGEDMVICWPTITLPFGNSFMPKATRWLRKCRYTPSRFPRMFARASRCPPERLTRERHQTGPWSPSRSRNATHTGSSRTQPQRVLTTRMTTTWRSPHRMPRISYQRVESAGILSEQGAALNIPINSRECRGQASEIRGISWYVDQP